ncbi:hypothetical protein J40TS1_00280 [Paenibacillus montaniterrae]|uniref:Bacterial toxin 50 domain-containing protein n=1 Tax=Paenibacillus montaniterrae TaxID=429341 RepID=A0A919YLP8_9BACL|nr:phage minor capsid protein [Paenibacillus montaniterrae]GIP14386.1 hypothetical protein J40TS1_00280 [Paenibacillus montaniterrae]
MPDPYDVREVFERMTLDLIGSLKRNLKRHQTDEIGEGFRWEQWQAGKLRALANYQKTNRRLIRAAVNEAEELTGAIVKQSYDQGSRQEESRWNRIINFFLKPFGLRRETFTGLLSIPENIKPLLPAVIRNYLDMPPPTQEDSFFALNTRKLDALQEGIMRDLQATEGAIYRKMDDVYRQVVYRTSHYVTAGAVTINQAMDMATKEFLSRGIDCITYRDGRKVNIAAYAEMALRTVSQRATFLGEGSKRDEWGVYTVVMSAHGNCSPMCLPFQGRVFIDDVYTSIDKTKAAQLSNQTGYMRLSYAMSRGAFHPNCRHTLATFFPGVSRLPDVPVEDEVALTRYDAEQQQRYMERQIRKYKRLEAGSMDDANQAKYAAKVKEWQERIRAHLADNDYLRRDRKREKVDAQLGSAERNKLLKTAADREKIKEIQKLIRSTEQPKGILRGQQNKHIPGTHEYNQYVEKLKIKGQYGPSRLTISQEEVTELVKQYAGTGSVKLNKKGEWDRKETILVNDRIIGKAVNNLTGTEADTSVFIIHYAKDGVHIVPGYPSLKKGRGNT